MRSLVLLIVLLLFVAVTSTSCYSSRKSNEELRGLMLQENLQLSRNKAFYSRHNEKNLRAASRKYAKNSRNR